MQLQGPDLGAVVHCYDPDGFESGHIDKVAESFTELLDKLDECDLV